MQENNNSWISENEEEEKESKNRLTVSSLSVTGNSPDVDYIEKMFGEYANESDVKVKYNSITNFYPYSFWENEADCELVKKDGNVLINTPSDISFPENSNLSTIYLEFPGNKNYKFDCQLPATSDIGNVKGPIEYHLSCRNANQYARKVAQKENKDDPESVKNSIRDQQMKIYSHVKKYVRMIVELQKIEGDVGHKDVVDQKKDEVGLKDDVHDVGVNENANDDGNPNPSIGDGEQYVDLSPCGDNVGANGDGKQYVDHSLFDDNVGAKDDEGLKYVVHGVGVNEKNANDDGNHNPSIGDGEQYVDLSPCGDNVGANGDEGLKDVVHDVGVNENANDDGNPSIGDGEQYVDLSPCGDNVGAKHDENHYLRSRGGNEVDRSLCGDNVVAKDDDGPFLMLFSLYLPIVIIAASLLALFGSAISYLLYAQVNQNSVVKALIIAVVVSAGFLAKRYFS